jgi:NTE family protein
MDGLTRRIRVALQGGGSHGAFTWGVLDRLLQDPTLRIEAASGASAGAMNAAMLVHGCAAGGRAGARELLRRFWQRVANAAAGRQLDADPDAGSPFQFAAALSGLLGGAAGPIRAPLPAGQPDGAGAQLLRDVLDGLIDPQQLGGSSVPRLIVAATRVRTGQARLFRDAEVTEEALLASACLPDLFPPVVIDGEALWDGGFSMNPPVQALAEDGRDCDILIVRLTPERRDDVPRTRREVAERATELAFAAPLQAELMALAAAERAAQPARRFPRFMRGPEIRLHMIAADQALGGLPGRSRMDTGWPFLRRLFLAGRETAEHWLAHHRHELGRRGSVQPEEMVAAAQAA